VSSGAPRGLFTEHLSWRWSSTSTSRRSRRPRRHRDRPAHPAQVHHHVIDYLGTFLIAAVATCLVLVASLGGTTWGWGSPQIIDSPYSASP